MNMMPFITNSVCGLRPSATLAINETCQRLIAEGHQVYRLGLGQSPFPVPDHVIAALRDNAHQKAYLPARGLPELCDAVTAHLLRTEGLERKGEQVLIGPGTKELLFLLQFAYEAELVLPSPGWVSYEPQATVVGRSYRWLHSETAGWGLDPDLLDKYCAQDPRRARLLVLNYPNNPSGHCYTAAELQAIAAVCRRYGVIVLSDEIYSGVHFQGEHVSIARYYPEGTIISNGLSKWSGAGGWRVGWFSFPQELVGLHRSMETLITETFTSVNSPAQYAAISALEDSPAMTTYLQGSRRILQALAKYCSMRLRAAGAAVVEPNGGFYLFPRFSNLSGVDSGASLCRALLAETGVAVLPGSDFGRPFEELSTRLAFVDFDGDAALRALDDSSVDEAFLAGYCGRTVEGLDKLCNWIESLPSR